MRLSQCCGHKSFSVPNTCCPESLDTGIMYTGFLGVLPVLWCDTTAQAQLWFLLQHQQGGMCLGLKQMPWREWISGLLSFVHPFSSQFSYLSLLSLHWLFHFLITPFLEKGGRERKHSIKSASTDFHFHTAYDNGHFSWVSIPQTKPLLCFFN